MSDFAQMIIATLFQRKFLHFTTCWRGSFPSLPSPALPFLS